MPNSRYAMWRNTVHIHYVLLMCVLSVSFMTCSCRHNQEHYAQIGLLEVTLDSVQMYLSSVDTAVTRRNLHTFNRNKEILGSCLPDSLKQLHRQLLGQYGQVYKPLRNFNRSVHALYDELAHSRNQLRALKQNIRLGRIDSAKAGLYIIQEKEALNRFSKKCHTIVDPVQRFGVSRFQALNPQIQGLVDGLGN